VYHRTTIAAIHTTHTLFSLNKQTTQVTLVQHNPGYTVSTLIALYNNWVFSPQPLILLPAFTTSLMEDKICFSSTLRGNNDV